MVPMFLTKSTTFIIGPVAELIGYIMNLIFYLLGNIGLPNIGLSIIIMTILIYMAMLPLTIRQQKFSKLQRKMQPEINKIQKKYQGRKDNDSVAAQQEEIRQVYDKYGVSATGSCVQLIIQMPILFALYRVFYNIPAYLPLVKDAFFPLVDKLYELDPAAEVILSQDADGKYLFSSAAQFAKQLTANIEADCGARLRRKRDGEPLRCDGRFDIGDGEGGLIRHICNYGEWERTHGEFGQALENPPDTNDRLRFAYWLQGFVG